MVAKGAGGGIVRHDAEPDLVRDQHRPPFDAAEAGGEALDLGGDVAARAHEIAEPEGEAIDQKRTACAVFGLQRLRQRERRLDGAPALAPAGAVRRDACRHLGVVRLRRGDVEACALMVVEQGLRMGALARAGTAENEGDTRRNRRCATTRHDPPSEDVAALSRSRSPGSGSSTGPGLPDPVGSVARAVRARVRLAAHSCGGSAGLARVPSGCGRHRLPTLRDGATLAQARPERYRMLHARIERSSPACHSPASAGSRCANASTRSAGPRSGRRRLAPVLPGRLGDMAAPAQGLQTSRVVGVLVRGAVERDEVIALKPASLTARPAPVAVSLEHLPAYPDPAMRFECRMMSASGAPSTHRLNSPAKLGGSCRIVSSLNSS